MREAAFDDDDVDRAIDYMDDLLAESMTPTVTYTQLFEQARIKLPRDMYLGGESHMITLFMRRFHFRCRERNKPPYDSLVVNASPPRKDKPGSGYFTVNDLTDPFSGRGDERRAGPAAQFWEDQQEQCWNPRAR